MSGGEVSTSSPELEVMSKTLHDGLHLRAHANQGEQAPLKNEELHMVMVPYPLQGHINPMMQFAKALVTKYDVKISFINIKHHHDCMLKTRIRSSSAPANGDTAPSSLPNGTLKAGKRHAQNEEKLQEKLQFMWVDNGLPDDFDYTDLTPRFHDFHVGILNMKDPLKQLLLSLKEKSPPISCVVFGSFSPLIHTVTAELGIPSVFFWTQSTAVLSLYYHIPLLDANGFFPYKKPAPSDKCNEDDHETAKDQACKLVSYVPGVPPLHLSSFPSLLRVDSLSDPILVWISEQFSILPNCRGIIVNSFEELERDAYQAMQEKLPFPVSLVGPLVPSAFLEEGDVKDTSIGASLLDEKIECVEWLNRQRKHSVLYVSFGSLFHPSAQDLESVANGIRASKQPFLWVIRPRTSVGDVADILPKGFLDDTKEHGLIIPWAPQAQVLSNPSVGAFLTHCGWNSTLESVSMGVPMIPCPLLSDQPTNSAYACEVWKIGMALKRHDDGTIRSSDVESVVRTVLQGSEGEERRKRAMELREAARRAVRAQGSSSIHMEEFIETIRNAN